VKQVSTPPSHTPLPQTVVGQSGSVAPVQAGPQQASRMPHGSQALEHDAEHVPAMAQTSVVQAFPSLQSAAARQSGAAHWPAQHRAPQHDPAQHVPATQTAPSALVVRVHAARQVAGATQLSVVQSSPSAQSAFVRQTGATHTPPQHVPAPPPQVASSGTAVCSQAPPWQTSVVHAFASSQLGSGWHPTTSSSAPMS
jgi:hypothetical protein